MSMPCVGIDVVDADRSRDGAGASATHAAGDGGQDIGAANIDGPAHKAPREFGMAGFVARDAAQDSVRRRVTGQASLLGGQDRAQGFANAAFFRGQLRNFGK